MKMDAMIRDGHLLINEIADEGSGNRGILAESANAPARQEIGRPVAEGGAAAGPPSCLNPAEKITPEPGGRHRFDFAGAAALCCWHS
jgi:hypothetical protein